jgi:hypothetical protein
MASLRIPFAALLSGLCLLSPAASTLAAPPRPASPPPPSKSPRWTPADFGGVLSVGLEGHRSFQNGSQLFQSAGCARGHRFENFGTEGTRNLTLFARHSTPEALLEPLLQAPSHRTPNGKPLTDSLEQHQILDLLAFLISGGDPKSPLFQGTR